jgi:hypothetical protein
LDPVDRFCWWVLRATVPNADWSSRTQQYWVLVAAGPNDPAIFFWLNTEHTTPLHRRYSVVHNADILYLQYHSQCNESISCCYQDPTPMGPARVSTQCRLMGPTSYKTWRWWVQQDPTLVVAGTNVIGFCWAGRPNDLATYFD